MKKTIFPTTGLLACLLLVLAAGCDKQTTTPTEKPTLEGRWSGFESGMPDNRLSLQFEGNQFTYWDAETNEIGGGTFVINDTVQPMEMDLTFERIITPEYEGKVGLAIFELNGDEMRIAGAEPGTTVRPTNIAGGQGVRTFIWKREPGISND
jgi:uncharacterized protein (TIGR03067 family)